MTIKQLGWHLTKCLREALSVRLLGCTWKFYLESFSGNERINILYGYVEAQISPRLKGKKRLKDCVNLQKLEKLGLILSGSHDGSLLKGVSYFHGEDNYTGKGRKFLIQVSKFPKLDLNKEIALASLRDEELSGPVGTYTWYAKPYRPGR